MPRELAAFNGRPTDSDSTSTHPCAKTRRSRSRPHRSSRRGAPSPSTRRNDTIRKLAENQHVGAAILAESNDLPFKIDVKSGQFTLLDADGQLRFGLFPGEKLALPAGATYLTVVSTRLQASPPPTPST